MVLRRRTLCSRTTTRCNKQRNLVKCTEGRKNNGEVVRIRLRRRHNLEENAINYFVAQPDELTEVQTRSVVAVHAVPS